MRSRCPVEIVIGRIICADSCVSPMPIEIPADACRTVAGQLEQCVGDTERRPACGDAGG